MNKKEFLKSLEAKLNILEDTEIKDIISEYSDHIDQKIKDGKTEIEAINDFGNIDDLTKEILSAYKIKDNYRKSDFRYEKEVNNFIDKVVVFFEHFTSRLTKMNSTQILEVIIKVILVFMLASLLQIPFRIISSIITSLFRSLPGAGMALSLIWRGLAEVILFVLSVLFLYFALKKLLDKEFNIDGKTLSDHIDEALKKEQEKNSKYDQKDRYETNKTYERNTNIETKSGLYLTMSVILKIFAIMFMIPIIGSIIGLSVALAVIIMLIINGIIIIDALLIILGLIFIFGSMAGMIHHLAFKVVK